MKAWLMVVLWWSLSSQAVIQENVHKRWDWKAEGFPNPWRDPIFCGRYKQSWLCDPDDLLVQSEANELDALIHSIYNSTPCICVECTPDQKGIPIGVALVKYVESPTHIAIDEIASNFSETVRSRWKLGECGNDLLILIAVHTSMIHVAIGPRTSHFVTTVQRDQIYFESRYHFREKKYFNGLKAMLNRYGKVLRDIQYHPRYLNVKSYSPVLMVMGILAGSVALALLTLGSLVLYKRKFGVNYRYPRQNKRCIDAMIIAQPGILVKGDKLPIYSEQHSFLDEHNNSELAQIISEGGSVNEAREQSSPELNNAIERTLVKGDGDIISDTSSVGEPGVTRCIQEGEELQVHPPPSDFEQTVPKYIDD